MATIIRVKRRLSEEPASSLVVSYKRIKSDSSNNEAEAVINKAINESDKRLFTFAGTVTQESDPADPVIKAASKKQKFEKILKDSVESSKLIDKWREDVRTGKHLRRLKVIDERRRFTINENLSETTDESESHDLLEKKHDATGDNVELLTVHISEEEPSLQHLVEAFCDQTPEVDKCGKSPSHKESSIACNGVPMVKSKTVCAATNVQPQDYVYDIYYIQNAAPLAIGEQIVDVEAFYEELNYDYGLMNDGEEEVYEDEDDSNDENNWRNDYPDEDAWKSEDEYCHEDAADLGTFGGCEDEDDLIRRLTRGFHAGLGDDDLSREFDEYNDDDDDVCY